MIDSKHAVEVLTAFGMTADSKADAIEQSIHQLTTAGYLNSENQFTQDVFDREQVLTTYVGYGIGLPHSKSDAVTQPALVIARLTQPVDWDGEHAITLIFLIAVPKTAANDLHLKILAQLSRMLMHEDFRDQLLTADAPTVQALIRAQM